MFYLNDESAAVGEYIIAVSLKDESHKVFYYLDVIIEANTAPYFASSEIGHIDGSMKAGSLLNIYTLSQMIDDEGDQIFVEIDPGRTGSFARFDSHANKIFFNLDDTVSPGQYSFKIYLSDGYLTNSYKTSITVLENSAPYFAYFDEEIIELKWNSQAFTWIMPPMLDDEGDEIRVRVDLGNT